MESAVCIAVMQSTLVHNEACRVLEAELRRTDGAHAILVVGERRSGKTTVCETVLKCMGRHIIRWSPYEEFLAGNVSSAYSSRDTIIFVDDADVLVRLTKGSSVGLVDAINACKERPKIRIVMTALDTKGRVWKSVASQAGTIQTLCASTNMKRGVREKRQARDSDGWDSVIRSCDRAVSSKMMTNWCDAQGPQEDDKVYGEDDSNTDSLKDFDGGVIRTIAHTLLTAN